MKAGAGKHKGGKFERYCCERLSLWMSHGMHDDWYWRSAMSGGRATVKRGKGKANTTQCGDVSCIDARGQWLTDRFVISAKHVAELNITAGILKNIGKLAKFWTEVYEEARLAEKQPMLIARQNQYPVVVLIRPYALIGANIGSEKVRVTLPGWDAVVMLFDDMLSVRPRMSGGKIERIVPKRSA
jgi:hypothetical protein